MGKSWSCFLWSKRVGRLPDIMCVLWLVGTRWSVGLIDSPMYWASKLHLNIPRLHLTGPWLLQDLTTTFHLGPSLQILCSSVGLSFSVLWYLFSWQSSFTFRSFRSNFQCGAMYNMYHICITVPVRFSVASVFWYLNQLLQAIVEWDAEFDILQSSSSLLYLPSLAHLWEHLEEPPGWF